MSPRKLPPFFRYTVIMRGVRSRRGKKRVVRTVQGVFFAFSPREYGRFEYMREKVKEIALEEPSEWWEEVGEEFAEEVTHDEAKGVGFYRIAITIDERPAYDWWEWIKGKFRLG